MPRRPPSLHFRNRTILSLRKLYKPIRPLTCPALLFPFVIFATLVILIIIINLSSFLYPSLNVPAKSDQHAIELARIAVRDQLSDDNNRLSCNLFSDDAKNEAILIQQAKIPPVFVTRLGPKGRRHLLHKLTVDSNNVPAFSAMPKVIIVDVQNGLGNRLRALGSAMEFAFNTRRVLIVLWAADAHINATMARLFHPDLLSNLLIIEQPVEWPINPNDIHPVLKAPGVTKLGDNSYMKIFSFMAKDRDILDATSCINNFVGMHIYVKTAYILQSYYTQHNLINAFVQALIPAPAVTKLVQDVERRCGGPGALSAMVGVHIRSRSIAQDNDAVDHECEYTVDGAAMTDKWRAMSTPEHFIPEMRRMRAQWPAIVKQSHALMPTGQWFASTTHAHVSTDIGGLDVVPVDISVPPRFYVSADSVGTLESLHRAFSKVDIVSLPRDCDDRSAACIVYAFADLILLSRTGALLASGWSSFSEVAARLRIRRFGMDPNRNDGYVIRTSGTDFGGPSLLKMIGAMAQPWLRKVGAMTAEEVNGKLSREERRKLCEERKRSTGTENNITLDYSVQ